MRLRESSSPAVDVTDVTTETETEMTGMVSAPITTDVSVAVVAMDMEMLRTA